jgi:hypothetical protein
VVRGCRQVEAACRLAARSGWRAHSAKPGGRAGGGRRRQPPKCGRGQHPVGRRDAKVQSPRDFRHTMAVGLELPRLGLDLLVDHSRPAELLTLGARCCNPIAALLVHYVPFELRHGSQDGQQELAVLALAIELRLVEKAHGDALGAQLLHSSE